MSKGKRVATCLWSIFNIVNNPRPPTCIKVENSLGQDSPQQVLPSPTQSESSLEEEDLPPPPMKSRRGRNTGGGGGNCGAGGGGGGRGRGAGGGGGGRGRGASGGGSRHVYVRKLDSEY